MGADTAALFTGLVVDYLADTRDESSRVSTALSYDEIAARFDEPIPRTGIPLATIIERLRREVIADANHLYHPRYVGHQVCAPIPVAIWTESLAAALNQSLAVQEMSPTTTALEHRVISWMCELVGWDSHSGGTLTSGGTEATLTALLAARAAAVENVWAHGLGENPPVLICGEHAHYAVTRAAGVMGLGMRSVLVIPTLDGRMDTAALRATLDRLRDEGRQVMAVVATAGSTATGSFDDLTAIGEECTARDIWLHVDGAHGASALLSDRDRHRLDGIHHARSIAWDPHKLLLMPLSAGVVLVRRESDLEAAFAQKAPYLFHGAEGEWIPDQGVRSLQCSRRADVLKLWVALQRHGTDGIGALHDHLCDVAMTMHDLLVEHPAFEPLHRPESNILCFRWIGDGTQTDDELDAVNRSLRERYNRSGHGWITATYLGGRRALRVTIMNHRTTAEHVRQVIDGLAREASTLA